MSNAPLNRSPISYLEIAMENDSKPPAQVCKNKAALESSVASTFRNWQWRLGSVRLPMPKGDRKAVLDVLTEMRRQAEKNAALWSEAARRLA